MNDETRQAFEKHYPPQRGDPPAGAPYAFERGYVAAAEIAAVEVDSLSFKLDKATAELAERDASFELRWKADMWAIARWRAEKPEERDLLAPDHADLCVWLMDKLELHLLNPNSSDPVLSGPEGSPDRVAWLQDGSTMDHLNLGPFTYTLNPPLVVEKSGWYLMRLRSPGQGKDLVAGVVRMVQDPNETRAVPPEFFSKEDAIDTTRQAIGELRGFATALAKGTGGVARAAPLTAAQLTLVLDLAEKVLEGGK